MQLFSKTAIPMAAFGFLAIASPLVLNNTPPLLKAATAQTQPADMEMGNREFVSEWEFISEWEFVSEEGRFSVVFPGVPTRKEEYTGRDGTMGQIALVDENSSYMVLYQELPTMLYQDALVPTETLSDEEILNTFRDDIVQNHELLSEQDIELDGHPGKEIEVQMPEGYMKARIYWVEYHVSFVSRVYLVIASAPTQEDAIAQDTDRFLGSFMLLD